VAAALRIARGFMEARQFRDADLQQVQDRVSTAGPGGVPLVASVTFRGILGGDGEASLSVNLAQGAVATATLTAPRPVPPGNWRKPDMTLEQARAALDAELAKRGFVVREVVSGEEDRGAAWQRPDNPMYCFVLDLEKPTPAGVPYVERDIWYVDGITGKACPYAEVPAVKKWNAAVAKWNREQTAARRAKEAPHAAPPVSNSGPPPGAPAPATP
jgi:hypothetical protein